MEDIRPLDVDSVETPEDEDKVCSWSLVGYARLSKSERERLLVGHRMLAGGGASWRLLQSFSVKQKAPASQNSLGRGTSRAPRNE